MPYLILGFVFLTVGATALVFLWELPILTSSNPLEFSKRYERTRETALEGSVLFLSDAQLTDPSVRYPVKTDGAENIVFVGDLFHSPEHFERFGETNEERLRNGLSVFLPESFSGSVYVISAHTHDPELPELEFERNGVRVVSLGKIARLRMGETSAVVMHGNELSGGIIGGGVSWLGLRLGVPLPLERLARKKLGVPEEAWMITGHTHVPALHEESRTANTGSLAGVPFNWFFRLPVGTGIFFDGERFSRRHFPGFTSSYLWRLSPKLRES